MKNKKIGAVVFGLITKMLFTALCALLSVFSLNRLFWGGSDCSRQLQDNRKIKGKSLRHTTPSRVLQIFIETCSLLVPYGILPTKLAGYSNKKFVYVYNR